MIQELGRLKNSQDRFACIVQRGRQCPPLDDSLKTETFRVEGCLAKLWLVSEFRAGKCYFKADSDSAIVKGIAAILCEFYSGQTPETILATEPSFLEKVGINQHLTQNRRHSLGKIWKHICAFAALQKLNTEPKSGS